MAWIQFPSRPPQPDAIKRFLGKGVRCTSLVQVREWRGTSGTDGNLISVLPSDVGVISQFIRDEVVVAVIKNQNRSRETNPASSVRSALLNWATLRKSFEIEA